MAISITQFMPIFASNPLDGQLGTQQDHRGLGSSALQAAVGDLFHPRLYSLFGGGEGRKPPVEYWRRPTGTIWPYTRGRKRSRGHQAPAEQQVVNHE